MWKLLARLRNLDPRWQAAMTATIIMALIVCGFAFPKFGFMMIMGVTLVMMFAILFLSLLMFFKDL